MLSSTFKTFSGDLDDYNDRRERLIKASRDVTTISKRTIFLLHRVVIESDADDAAASAAAQGRAKLKEAQNIYASIKHELEGDRFWRYERQVSPGLQEYIEALSFAHYLEHKSLITFDEVQKTLCDADGVPHFPLTIADYLLGLSDLTGELMRFAISAMGRRGGRVKASEVYFERMTPYIFNLSKKQAVTAQSLEKLEDAAYAIVVRGSEYDLPQEMLDDIVAQSVSRISYGHDDNQRTRWRHENDRMDEI
ncbi:hypothetical protein H0H92_004213 [Tricholoma furcatifolium]|nr:hypothetical protein H0H92_004213 [Tricholoma furcatifolium]